MTQNHDEAKGGERMALAGLLRDHLDVEIYLDAVADRCLRVKLRVRGDQWVTLLEKKL